MRPPVGGYLVGLRGPREDTSPSPYLAEPGTLLNGMPVRFTNAMQGRMVKPVTIKDERAHPGVGAQILHDQQLRILSSLYGTPIRGFGVPPATDAAGAYDGRGIRPAGKRPGGRVAVGSGVAVAKAMRGTAVADADEGL